MPTVHLARHHHQKKGRWHIFRSLFFVLFFSVAAFFFLQSSFFNIREIVINGNKRLSSKEIIELSGLKNNVNIFKANLNLAKDKVSLQPMVKQAAVIREFPATVVINITERIPVALVAGTGGFIVVSEDGFHLKKVTSLESVNLPIITGTNVDSIVPGQLIEDRKFKAALGFLLAMPLNIRAAVSEINVSDLNNIRMYAMDKAEVRFGDEQRINDKIKLYSEVISQKYSNKIQYIDISYKGSPVIKFIESSGQETEQQP
jgi:cell division protein FtsQ